MTGVGNLGGLTFAAVGRAPHHPVIRVADCITAIPKLRGDAGVGAIAQHASHLAVLDLVADLGAELEVVALIVDRPRAVGFHVNAILGIGDQVVKFPRTGLQADVDHADDRDAVPAGGAHAGIRVAPELASRLARHQVTHEQAILHQRVWIGQEHPHHPSQMCPNRSGRRLSAVRLTTGEP